MKLHARMENGSQQTELQTFQLLCRPSECSCLDTEGPGILTEDSFLLFSPHSVTEISPEMSSDLILLSPSRPAPPNHNKQLHPIDCATFSFDESVIVVSPSTSHSTEPDMFMSPIPTLSPVTAFTPPELANLSGPQHSTPVITVTSAGHITSARQPHKRRKLSTQFLDEQPLGTSVPSHQSPAVTLSETVVSNCCAKECICSINKSTQDNIQEVFKSKSIIQQNQFLLDSFNISSHCGAGHTIEGKAVCKEAFIKILGISRRRYARVYDQYSKGATISIKKKPDREKSTRTSEAKAWMTHFFNGIGDHMPHTQQTHLPHFLTKIDVYNRMKRELRERGISESDIISRSHFYALWECDFKKVVIPEVSMYQL